MMTPPNPLDDFLTQMEAEIPNDPPDAVSKEQPIAEEPSEDAEIPAAAEEAPEENLPDVQEPSPDAAPGQISISIFDDALAQAKEQNQKRTLQSITDKKPFFLYGTFKDEITDQNITFEQLREAHETTIPALQLEDKKTVTWKVEYAGVTKTITNPASDTIAEVKQAIEKSKAFKDGVEKSKSPEKIECLVKPVVTGKSKGELKIPAYKEYCTSLEQAEASPKPLVIIPARNGKLYERRKTPIGVFTAPAGTLPELPEVVPSFSFDLPKIPIQFLYRIIHFFKDAGPMEALIVIWYDRQTQRYQMQAPEQTVSYEHIHTDDAAESTETCFPVMDIHSHHYMPAEFSRIDDLNEKDDQLYAVVGDFAKSYPSIFIRASCGGKYIPVPLEDVFDLGDTGYPDYLFDYITQEGDGKCDSAKTRR